MSAAITHDVDLLLERAAVAGRNGGADPGIALVPQDLDARVAGAFRSLSGHVARAVVHDEDRVDELGDAADGLAHEPLLVEGGHHDRHPLAVEHQLE